MKLLETVIPMNYSKGLFEEKYMDIAAEHTDKISYILFSGASDYLASVKNATKPVALVFEDYNKAFLAAAIVRYFENDDKSKPGNWNLVWTFYESDIPEDAIRVDFDKETKSHSYFRGVACTKYGMQFKTTECLTVLITYLLKNIYKWLDENASKTEEVMVEDDWFQARVAVENGEKIFAIEPKGEIKMLIKDDAAIQK